jgi:hypothetical protein
MVNIKTLLPDLKKLVRELEEDLLTRAIENAEINSGLRAAFTQIEKGGRTAQAFEVWREDYLDQVAVAWVLACVFVRFMEDNHLIDECWLAGEGERRKLADDTHELFFRKHPHETDREYFQHVFHEVAKISAGQDLFAEGKTPIWAVSPSGDAAMKLLAFWREIDAETGHLKRSFEAEAGDTRFLGDLYQELSERAKKKYALLQTPVFVEEFILDRTLNPALDEFGLDTVRMIDPTCGSGHFLLGGFARLFHLWLKRETNEIVAVQKALDGVWGVDINPFAVAIARFRLIVAALVACGIRLLKHAPGWTIHLATGDSLLFGSRWNRTGEMMREQSWFATDERSWAPEIYACEDKQALQEVLGQQYHAVVGNPPYIIVRDRTLNAAYRDRYVTCHQKYSLAVPFSERFFDLALASQDGRSGFVGMITANSFMKREFGKKLIEEFLPRIDLTHVVDTSGAYIPGHTTPTVILFGRNRIPNGESVRAVLGISGEPYTPVDASQGAVWKSIIQHIDQIAETDEFTSTADVPRTTFHSHPWSIGGGGAAELKEHLDESAADVLGNLTDSIGIVSVTGEDDLYVFPCSRDIERLGVQDQFPLILGEMIRDHCVAFPVAALWPYDKQYRRRPEAEIPAMIRLLWTCKTSISERRRFGTPMLEKGATWYEWQELYHDKLCTPLSIAFAFVATHNHFVLDRGGKVFKQSVGIIKLPADTPEYIHISLLGILNSSLACFWMKQVFYPKSTSVKDLDTERGKPEANRYDFASTGLLSFPLPNESRRNESRVFDISDELVSLAIKASSLLPAAVLSDWDSNREGTSLSRVLSEAECDYQRIKRRMIALQEELDWEVYRAYSLTEEGACEKILTDHLLGIEPEDRPFLWEDNHASDGVPVSWKPVYEKRKQLLRSKSRLTLVETPVYKRPWWGRQGVYGQASRTYREWIVDASREWLLGRLESSNYWPDANQHICALQSIAQLADRASGDHDFLQVAASYRGRPDFDVLSLVRELVESESVPFLPILRYKPTGLRKREVWERTWDLQRGQDAGENVGNIPVPPKYTSADFLKQDYWRLRGKLDVPKERWISYPHLQNESDPSLVVGWAGWNHLQLASALVSYYDTRKREGWETKRLTPILAGLDQLLPWIHQWHPEIDPEFGDTAGQSYQSLLENDAHELGLTLDDIRNWQPPHPASRRRTRT